MKQRMSEHEKLLAQGPREAPEPETAEERSRRTGLKTAGGGIAAGGIGLAKAGILGKFFLWFLVWHGVCHGRPARRLDRDHPRRGRWQPAFVLYRRRHAAMNDRPIGRST